MVSWEGDWKAVRRRTDLRKRYLAQPWEFLDEDYEKIYR